MQPTPRLAPPHEVQACLDRVDHTTDLSERIDGLSAFLLGRPYLAFSLIGGPTTDEALVTRLDGLDCVTFTESVLALAHSRSVDDYPRALQDLRYHHGRLRWIDRNHFMNGWIERNAEAGWVRPLIPDRWVDTGQVRALSALPGYPVQRWPVRYLPSTQIDVLRAAARTGDVVCFVSDRDDLDTFHVGLLVVGDALAVRHASRSRAAVVHQDLAEFLDRNAVAGMLLARPIPSPPEST